MKKLLTAGVLIGILAGCGEQQSAEEVANTAYQWEKAYMNGDYAKEQELLYEKGSLTVHKGNEAEESGLKKKDIRYEVYYDEEFDWYYVLTEYENPEHGNTVKSELIIREKGDSWKVDYDRSSDLVRREIQKEFERISCINCK